MEEIVCNINNTDPESLPSKSAFTVVEALTSHPMSGVHSFMQAIDRFTMEDFRRVNQKVQNEQNHLLYLTEKDLIVFYSVIYFASVAVNSHVESQWLTPYYSGKETSFDILKQQITEYAKAISKQLLASMNHLKDFREVTRMIPVE